jgi:phosphoribosylanthranilate isomerase
LTVDAGDAEIEAILCALRPELLQLHGSETPERVAEIKARFGLPVIKAIGVGAAQDIEAAEAFEGVADMLLFDAKPAPDAASPGGAGVTFDWGLLRNIGAAHWILSGGLDPDNVARAIEATNAPGVDVSSGVESARGVKDVGRIKDFIAAVRALSSKDQTV